MFTQKLKTGIVLLIAFLGLLLAGGGLTLGLRANAGPGAEPQGAGAQGAGKEEQARDKPGAEAPRTVTVSRPVRRRAAPYQDYTGRLEACRAVEVRPTVSGVVVKVGFKAGAEVKQGDVLFELDPRTAQLALDRAQAELAQAEAKKRLSEVELKRLRAMGQLAATELDQTVERVAAAQAAVKAAKVDVDRARLDLEATKVAAPMSGQAGRPLVDPGTLVFRGPDRATLLTTITSLDPIGLTFEMDEQSFLRYRRLLRENQVKGAGSSLRMHLVGENGFPHEGTLDSFENRVNPATGTVSIRGRLPNPGRLLLPGMFARVRTAFGPPRAVLEVPEEAVQSDQGKNYVLVVGEGNIAQRRAVTVGQADDGMRIIDKGLGPDDWVVIAGLAKVRPGDPVQPRKKAAPERADPAR